MRQFVTRRLGYSLLSLLLLSLTIFFFVRVTGDGSGCINFFLFARIRIENYAGHCWSPERNQYEIVRLGSSTRPSPTDEIPPSSIIAYQARLPKV